MLKDGMTDQEIGKVLKKKAVYQETYIKGTFLSDKQDAISLIQREGSIVEVQKRANHGDNLQSMTVRIVFNAK
jgi:hypothetical protein